MTDRLDEIRARHREVGALTEFTAPVMRDDIAWGGRAGPSAWEEHGEHWWWDAPQLNPPHVEVDDIEHEEPPVLLGPDGEPLSRWVHRFGFRARMEMQ